MNKRAYTNKELAEAYIRESDNDKDAAPLQISYIKNSSLTVGYWIDRKREQTLTADDMQEITRHILNKMTYYIDVILDNYDLEYMSSNEWAFDEVAYIQRIMKNLINGSNYSGADLSLLESSEDDFALMATLAQLEKILLDISVEFLDCESDSVKFTNFINGMYNGIQLK